MYFDGNDDKVNLNTTISDLSINNSSFSVSVDVSALVFGSNSSEDIIIGTEMSGGNSDNGFKVQTGTLQNFGAAVGGPNGNDTYHLSGSSKSANQWYNVTIVVDRANNVFYLYVDGILEDQIIILDLNSSIGSGLPIELGYYYSSNHYFNGLVDETRIWSKALTQQEIQDYMNCPPTGTESG